MTRVLLVHPEESRTRYDFQGIIENECLDLEWIQAILQDHGYEVTIFDRQVEKLSFQKFIEDKEYDVFYGEARCFQETFILEYAVAFKERFHGLVILGGPHAQINQERFFIPEADLVLSGYNYYDLPLIIEGNRDACNLSYRKDGKWICNERRAVDIGKMPLPDRSYFYAHPDRYPYLDLKHAMWLRSSFCCPYRCEFCLRNHMNRRVYSRRDVKDLVDEIELNDNENVYLVDDDFLFDESYVRAFIDEIRRRKISRNYICYGRADFIAAHEDIISDFKDIGLYYVLTGLEDFRDEKLDSYQKRNSVENNERCIEICQRNNVNLMAMFILGLDFKGKDFRELYAYIRRHHLRHVAVSVYTPELGIAEAADYITEDPSDFDYLHLVAKPKYLSVRAWYFHYYVLLIRLFLKGWREGVYDFIDYGDYIRSFIRNIFVFRKEEDHV
ncbi:MAG: radical SAM protein [Erysipelotrichaceae bacterium]|nr:radical SAM protein [Erysipelotrichaceae bacterium]